MNQSPLPSPQGLPGQTAPKRPWLPAVLGLLLVIVLAGAGWWTWKAFGPSSGSSGPGGARAAVRTTVIEARPLRRTLRLTGSTTAERFSSLVVPRLRGNRGSVNVAGGGSMITISVSGSSSGSSSTSSSSSTFRATTNRFSSSSATSSSSSSSSSSTSTSSSTSSSSSGSSGSGDRMSGGSNDFMQVLQEVSPAGSRVEQGKVVAAFDPQFQQQRLDDYVAAVEQYERTMRSIDAQIDVQRKSLGQNIQSARGAVEKAQWDLKTTPVRSRIEAEQLKLALEEAQATLKQYERQVSQQEISLKSQRRSAELDLEQGQIELKRAQRNVDMMTVKAPINGMLAMENTFRGSDFSQIQQGDQLFPGQMFARVVDTSSMLVSATVNQTDVEQLRVGAKALMHFDAYPGLELPAHVISIAAMPSTGGQRATYVKEVPVYLKIDKMDPRVIPDLSVSVDVILATAEPMPVVPIESIFWDATGDHRPYVFVRTASGFVRREIELGLSNNVRVAVRSGVKPGDSVALELPAQQKNSKQQKASLTPATWSVPDALTGRESIFGVVHV